MRLLIVASHYPPLTGGAASRISDFARIIASQGHSCYVVTYLPFRMFWRTKAFEIKEGVHILRLPSLLPKNPIDQIIPVLLIVLGFALGRRPRTVIMSLPAGEPAIGALLGAKLGRLRTVFDIRDEWEEAIIRRRGRVKRLQYQFYKQLFTVLYSKANLSIGVTPALVQSLQQRGVTRVLMIPNGADTELFKPQGRDEVFLREHPHLRQDDFLAIYAGQVDWPYRIDLVLQAIAELGKSNSSGKLKFIVMGNGEKLDDYKQLAVELGLQKSVIFTGNVPRVEVAEVMNRCDIGVIPYDGDSLWRYAYPTKIFEHCAAGLPTVVSIISRSELERLVNDYKIGIVVEPSHVDEFANAIETLMADPLLHDEMKKNAIAAAAKFSRQKTAKDLLKALNEDL